MGAVPLGDIVAAVGGRLQGDPAVSIARIAPLETAGEDAITFIAQARLTSQLRVTRAAAVIVAPALAGEAPAGRALVLADDPYLYFARLTQWWAGQLRPRPAAGVHASAVIEAGARVAASASVGPLAWVGAGAVVGERARIGAQCSVGARARVGDDTLLHPRVTIADDCIVGARCVFQSGAVIGADGFGIAPAAGQWERIEQLGAVRIGNDVDIGANTCIDRGALEDTVLEDGVKLDNQIQIGHNCHIGAHTVMAACVGIAGSTRVGRNVMIGGAAMINGHIEIADGVTVSASTMVMHSLRRKGTYTAIFPIDEHASWEKNAVTLRNLHALRERVRALEKKAAEGQP
ncbi:MAG TPA: UDP-3-O-(3-hydroxymyristoyl)glucosamine N-acyltransferase [Burkholderiaceae bacterium]|jgi:UDP-3-O-[3-hydroxymyristoyl] glucosamine N-acyltransferase|nr:UDP-3-O-(3-hydroxymyristoyl)glucosamine N-acyltransferase [Burkholderiaceae bacterium]